jgi:hypothetical protein
MGINIHFYKNLRNDMRIYMILGYFLIEVWIDLKINLIC